MGPKAKLASLLLRHQGSEIDELASYSSEERSAMLFFLTRYGYLAEPRIPRSFKGFARQADAGRIGYMITERGQALLDQLAPH